ncbi:winged helix-turn-helix domain-containing protein [Rhizobium sp. BK251]|uniref:ATP-binding protein n=1 Tax=Rhizobium sp. BK251 TaxID=2512125 RepID=UPI00104DFFF7|nr:winged helix-turn-helix domain-containing protein [Rhizobium sp. BK251]TCL64699.1 putative ATPase [Rhizobium sp. BK251]
MSDRREVGEVLSFGTFRLFPPKQLLTKEGEAVAIGGRAFDILVALTDRPGEVVSARDLIDAVWPRVTVDDSNLRVHMTALRKVLAADKDGRRYIVNVPGRGYSFVAPVRRTSLDNVPSSAVPEKSALSQRLPAPPQFLLGRSEAIATLSSLLLAKRFVTLVGPGGIGKTTVAVAVARALSAEFGDDAIFFIDLGSLNDAADIPSAVASALGCLVQGSDPDPCIQAFLAERRTLIILDCCEHLVDAVSRLYERLYLADTGTHLLATSREALRVDHEYVYLLPPLDGPEDGVTSAAEALAVPSVQLFMKRALAGGYRTELTDGEASTVAKICRRLDGVPLAIELVASRVPSYGLAGVVDLLESEHGFLLSVRRVSSPRQQTLQSMLDWSFNLLSSEEQLALCQLAVFVGNFPLVAAHDIASTAGASTHAVNAIIASLVDKSLLQIEVTDRGVHYRMFDTTRAYAAAKLAGTPDAEAVYRRHARYYAELLKATATDGSLLDGRSAAAYARYVTNVRKALQWSFSSPPDRDLSVELAARAAPLFVEVSLFAECKRWCQLALNAFDNAHRGSRQELELRSALATALSYTRSSAEDIKSAVERGLELAETFQDWRLQLQLLGDLSFSLIRSGDFRGSLEATQRAAAVAETSGDPLSRAITAWSVGTGLHLTGDQVEALRFSERGFWLSSDFRKDEIGFFGYTQRLASLAARARGLWLCGFPDQARTTARQAIEEALEFENLDSRGIALRHAIPVLIWCGDADEALKVVDIFAEQTRKYGPSLFHAAGLSLRGEIMLLKGDPVLATTLLKDALSAGDAALGPITPFATRRALAEGLAICGQAEKALSIVDDVLMRLERSSLSLWWPDLLRARGEILLAQPRVNHQAAEASLLSAMEAARRQSALSWELKAALPLVRLWVEQGRIDDAKALIERNYLRFTEGFETPDLVAARQLVVELAHRRGTKSLPPHSDRHFD